MANPRHCQQAAFAQAVCRIELEPETGALTGGRYIATASVIDAEHLRVQPLVFRGGARVSFAGESQELALNTMVTYLEGKFGAFSEILYACAPEIESATDAEPLVVEAGPAAASATTRAGARS